jgi:hypothetical protein
MMQSYRNDNARFYGTFAVSPVDNSTTALRGQETYVERRDRSVVSTDRRVQTHERSRRHMYCSCALNTDTPQRPNAAYAPYAPRNGRYVLPVART